VIFLIGGWNLFAVNLARTPGEWWFWPVLAVWAGILAAHALWISRARWRGAGDGRTSGKAPILPRVRG